MRSAKFFLWSLAASTLILSCEDSSPRQGTLSPFAESFLDLKMGTMSSRSLTSSNGYANVANESFNRIGSRTSLSFGRTKEDSIVNAFDTAYYPSPWVSCATLTTTINSDKSVTSTYDYGEGCEEGNEYFKYFMFGKMTYTYLFESTREGSVYKDHYFGNSATENYGGRYYYNSDTSNWISNGSSTYSGTSQYDTVRGAYRGTYESEGEEVYRYNNIVYTYKGKGKGSYNERGSITLINDYSYSTEAFSYQTTVLDPLVIRYDCYSAASESSFYCFVPVYVAGREFVKYRDGNNEGSFVIDYGNGECDSIVEIIEDGERVVFDMYNRQVAN